MLFCMCFFFFKQKTAYEMRISDWSSDVCSSDLHDGPVLLSNLLDGALTELSTEQDRNPTSDGFLYSGNRHESVPRGLFLDRRLTPLERNAWQVFRLLLNDDGVTAFPTYDQDRKSTRLNSSH